MKAHASGTTGPASERSRDLCKMRVYSPGAGDEQPKVLGSWFRSLALFKTAQAGIW